MKKFLITGVSGFVSYHFIRFLEENEIKSSILGIDAVPFVQKRSYKFVQIEFRQMDLLNRDSIENTIFRFQPDYILHLASYSSVAFSWKNPIQSFRNNTNVFLNLIDSVRELGLNSRILSVGSSEVYGNINTDHLPLKEDSMLDPVSPYAVARVSQEMLSKVYADAYNVNVLMTRSFNHIGPNQKDVFVVSSFAKKVAELKKQGKQEGMIETGDLSIVRDFLDVRDVVRAYYLILDRATTGSIYNICSGHGISLKDVIDKLSDIAKIKIRTQINQNFIRPADNKKIIGSSGKMLEDFGWEPKISIDQSLTDIYRYWYNNI